MKKIISALIALVAVAASTACDPVPPPAAAPVPVDHFLEDIKKVISWFWYTPPDNTSIDCSVVLFDQSVNPNDFTAEWTPATNVNPQLLPAWLTACFGAQTPQHTVPTHKASGYPNQNPPNNPDKVAICWVLSFNPVNLGSNHFRCTFDRNSHTSWVAYLSLSRDGFMAVGR